MNKIFIGLVAVVLVIGAIVLINNKSQVSKPTTQNTITQAAAPNTATSVVPSTASQGAMIKDKLGTMFASTVTLTPNGFSPQTVTVQAGTKVMWINKSGNTATVNSDPHPIHTLWPFLNLGQFEDGKSVSVVFDKTGTFTYHNHLNPSQKGTVIVQ